MFRNHKRLLVGAGLAGLMLLAASVVIRPSPAAALPARAAPFVVDTTIDAVDATPGDGVCATATAICSLRAALQEANALTGSHTIRLPAGTYDLTVPGIDEQAAATGDLDITADITILGAGAHRTIIDGQQLDRVLDIQPRGTAAAARITGITLRHGNAGATNGGGIANHGTLTLTDVVISNNTARAGGGIWTTGALTLRDVTVSGNAARTGGGIVIDRTGTATLVRTSLRGNLAEVGGGIASTASAAVVLRTTTIADNDVRQRGGGIAHLGSGVLRLTNSTVSGNTARDGGGILTEERGTLAVRNVTISGNRALHRGGGIAHFSGVVRLGSVTLSDNAADVGGGLFTTGSPPRGTIAVRSVLSLHNSIVANSTAGGNCAGVHDSRISGGHNLEDADTCHLRAAGDKVTTNPRLGPLADNGGGTRTHALLPRSPAIDAGSTAGCPATDQRGIRRPQDGDGDGTSVCDIGAFELSRSGSVLALAGSPSAQSWKPPIRGW